jgi:hypothetical protein
VSPIVVVEDPGPDPREAEAYAEMELMLDPDHMRGILRSEIAEMRERPGLLDALLEYFFAVEFSEMDEFPTMERHNEHVMRRRAARERVYGQSIYS